ncbi:MAG TPA: cyclopropane fatty acyl phospholipid synthase [Patescibacteria group bacterium]|nr:cyclopropane fatty acyl phospholipid synthase [Patescibacteria group bacterium]
MSNKKLNFIKKLLNKADIQINGHRPWDIQVHNEALYDRILQDGSMGLGEAYLDAWWDVQKLDEFFFRVLNADLDNKIKQNLQLMLFIIFNSLFNRQRKSRAFIIGQHHYDLGNDLYQAMLDPRLTYTGAYWDKATNLAEAQEAKLDLVCRKLKLQAGQNILDIGGGWGSWAKYAAEKYDVKVTVLTVSKEQVALGQELCAGLPVTFLLQDYREVQGQFDHVVSLGMVEHVGYKNYRTYMEVASRCLKDSGLFLLHTIGGNTSVKRNDPWIEKYIFPNSMLPSVKQLGQAFEDIFVMEDWHNFSAYYDPTLMAWFKNFDDHWLELKDKYGDRFYRMWKYYLLSSAASFRSRKNQLWQIVLSKKGIPGRYKSVR